MSNVHRTLCDFPAAIECEEKRMDILGELGDVNGQIKCYCSLGSLYQLIGEIRNSLLYYNKAVINLKVKICKLKGLCVKEGGFHFSRFGGNGQILQGRKLEIGLEFNT